jgi:hypothetical protein
VVAIHNAVNERAWREILQWERAHGGKDNPPRLVKFRCVCRATQGRAAAPPGCAALSTALACCVLFLTPPALSVVAWAVVIGAGEWGQ